MPPAMKKKSWIIHFLSTSNVLEKWLNMYEKWIGNCINSTLEIVRIIWAPFIQYSVWVDFITPTGKWNFLRYRVLENLLSKLHCNFSFWNGMAIRLVKNGSLERNDSVIAHYCVWKRAIWHHGSRHLDKMIMYILFLSRQNWRVILRILASTVSNPI